MTKGEKRTIFIHRQFKKSILESQATVAPVLTGTLRKMVTLGSVVTAGFVLTILCLIFQPSLSPSGAEPAETIPRSLLGPPNPTFGAKFGLSELSKVLRQSDIFISVKTTKQFHRERLDTIIETWFPLARDETYFFTDEEDLEFHEKTNGHLRVTRCSSSHSRQALCCKMGAEFDAFLESSKKWFCHFDDDNYVNVPALVKKLQEFDHRQDWYLGKPSIPEPLEILDRENLQHKLKFWFATGGAGFCLSRSLAQRMLPIAAGGKFENVGDKIRLPDDVTMGYISEHLLNTPLTVIPEFHSHLEPQRFIPVEGLSDQISFSYSRYGGEMNVVDISGYFSEDEDPTRFKSLHCSLFPNFNWCRGLQMP